MKRLITTLSICTILISCSKEPQIETFEEFIKNNYFEGATTAKRGSESYVYSNILFQFDLTQSCIFRKRGEYIIEDDCLREGLNECLPNLFIQNPQVSDSGVGFRFKFEENESEVYPYDGNLIFDRDKKGLTLFLMGEITSEFKPVSKEDWAKNHKGDSCSE